ncbi:MAG: GIY-YIG nuclease family protein [Candidatus Heimdallarchaeaceae archaeon]
MKGIYRIQNVINGKIYIGSSSELNLRWTNHKSSLRTENSNNPYFQSSWNKYGEDSFEFEILLICEGFELLYYEQWFLDNVIRWGIDYNLAKVAGRALVGQTHKRKLTEEQVIEIRTKYSGGGITYVALGKEYGVHDSQIRAIILNKQWKNLNTPKLNKLNLEVASEPHRLERLRKEKEQRIKDAITPEEKLLIAVLGLKSSEIIVESIKIHWNMVQYG